MRSAGFGAAAVGEGGAGQSTSLTLARSIGDPGPLWRLFHPGVVVPGFIGMLSDR